MKNKILASIVVVFSLFWLWYYGVMVYDHFYYGAELPYHHRPPYFVSIINSFFALIGVIIGIRLFKKQLKIIVVATILFVLLASGILLDNFGYRLVWR